MKVRESQKESELNQALVMINLHFMINVHSSNTKQVIVLKVANRRTARRQ